MTLLDRWRRRRTTRREGLYTRILLAALDQGSLWELRRRLPDVRTARVQRAVWDLEATGYLTSHWEDQGPDRPRRKYYRTDDLGLAKWINPEAW